MSRKNVIVREVGQVFVQPVHVVNLKKIRFVLTGINNKAGNFRVRVKATNSNLGPDEKITANGITRGRDIRIESFISHEAAISWVEIYRQVLEQKQAGFGIRSTNLSSLDLADAQVARSLLPKEVSFVDCAKYWIEAHDGENITVNEFYQRWIQRGKDSGLKSRSLEERRKRTISFRERFGHREVRTIKTEEIENLVKGKGKNGLRNRKNNLSMIKAFFQECVDYSHIKFNPAHILSKKLPEKSIPKPKTILAIGEARALVEQARSFRGGELLAYVSLALFTGLRPSEIHGGEYEKHGAPGNMPLAWEDIRLDSDTPEIFVSDDKKQGRSRTAPIPKNCVVLLCEVTHLPLIPSKGMRSRFKKLYGNAGIERWQSDVMRRSCWSYLYNRDGEITMDKMARIAGNSAQILDRHYVKTLPAGLGEKYFTIGLPN
tara:strand:- start:27 stop:1322 length:1296 start_codon:yes stop_codon:yes gene_type:complete